MPPRRAHDSRLHELEGLVQRARRTIARAQALRARAEFVRTKADAVYKSASASCLRSAGRSASLIHDLENASHELLILQSRIDSVMKQTWSRSPALSTAAAKTKASAPLLAIHGSSLSTRGSTPRASGIANKTGRRAAASTTMPAARVRTMRGV